jgi:hypothetical protein
MVRYRLPMDAVSLPFAALALHNLYERGRRWLAARREVLGASNHCLMEVNEAIDKFCQSRTGLKSRCWVGLVRPTIAGQWPVFRFVI